MRRFVPSLVAAAAIAATSGCGTSGGSGFSSSSRAPSSVDHVIITGNSIAANDFFVAPGGTNLGIALAATAENGGGTTALYVPGVTFTWGARLVDPTVDPPQQSQYSVGPVPNGSVKTCPNYAATGLFAPPGLSFANLPLSLDQTGATPLAPGHATNQVYFLPVAGLQPPYCVLVTATNAAGSGSGSVVVVVASNPNGPS